MADTKRHAPPEESLDHALDTHGPPLIVEQSDPYVLQGAASATVEKIALKRGDAFMVTDARGDLPESVQETGLFWRGTRYLRSCDLFVEGRPLVSLSHSISDEEGSCQIDMTTPFLQVSPQRGVFQGAVHIRRVLELRGHSLRETITLTSFDLQPVRLTVGLRAGADFRDIFEVRGLKRFAHGVQEPPQVSRNGITLRYRGLDAVLRETRVALDPPADRVVNDGVFWTVELCNSQPVTLQVQARLSEHGAEAGHGFHAELVTTEATLSELSLPVVRSDNVFFNRVLTRGMHDLVMMCTMTEQGFYPYAGIPWYCCPFGRDALITGLEFLPWFPEIARGTLAFLAAWQGTKVDEFTEEQPGKILHEFRHGELANTREIPFIPYYGTVDATPLFLLLLEQYVRWTDDLDFLRAHWQHALAAARWMRDDGDCDGDLFLEYARHSSKGLVSQGWKDSWDAIFYADGALVEPTVALCEVQGYAYAAYRAMDYLARRVGEPAEGTRWLELAERLRERFLADFWWPEEDVFYLALDGEKRPCAVVSSNSGQCLWTGIVPQERADAMVARLMRPDMYSEWGIRTVSTGAARYNPMSYHNGSVWPHDTALVGAGFARYGYKEEAGKLLGNLYGVSLYFEGARLPELLCGFERRTGYGPTRYPVACSPQTWAAGAPFLLLAALLGFQPEAEKQRLLLARPMLPGWLREVELHGLRLGAESARLHFVHADGATAVTLTAESGIDVRVLSR
jgi:glycogen debranching enzyme